MSGPTAADYAWFDDEFGESLCVSGFCLTFVHDLSPEEAFERLGITPEKAETLDWGMVDHPVAAYAAIGGTVLLEDSGYAGTLTEVTRRLSAGTAMAAVFLDVESHQQFLYAADGHLVTGFETDGPDQRWGRAPDRLLDQMRELGMPLDEEAVEAYLDGGDDGYDPVLTAFALAERATGVRVTAGHLRRPPLVGSARHLY